MKTINAYIAYSHVILHNLYNHIIKNQAIHAVQVKFALALGSFSFTFSQTAGNKLPFGKNKIPQYLVLMLLRVGRRFTARGSLLI